ncbi:hypothetical protein MHYP_G00262850 [Metynnis hypsauchen]
MKEGRGKTHVTLEATRRKPPVFDTKNNPNCLSTAKRAEPGHSDIRHQDRQRWLTEMCSSSSEPHSSLPCPLRASRPRPRRVLYPPRVRKVLPKEDADPTRWWLILLSTLLFLQIYTEDGLWEAQEGGVQLGETVSEKPFGVSEAAVCLGLNTHTASQPECVVR